MVRPFFTVALITTATPNGVARRSAFERQLMGEEYLTFYGDSGATSDVNAVADRVFRAHYNTMLSLVRDPPSKYVLLCEDDCAFFGGELPSRRLVEISTSMALHGIVVCGVGVLGASWLVPTLWDEHLYYAPMSALSHCQLIDMEAIAPHVKSTRPADWKTPSYVESWQAIPLSRRLVHWPTLAYQSATPKELNEVAWKFAKTTVSSESFAAMSDAVTVTVGIALPLVVMVTIVSVLFVIRRKKQVSQVRNDIDERGG